MMIANEGTYQALVIDDEFQVREFVSDVLRGEGWDVTQSPSAEDAIERFDEPLWSVVFCDVILTRRSRLCDILGRRADR